MAKKVDVFKKLHLAWEEFNQSWAGLDDARMLVPGVMEQWSVRDVLAHVSWWEDEALKYLPLVLEGGRPPRYSVLYGGIDAFNAKMTDLRRELSLAEVKDQLFTTHTRLLEYLQAVPEDAFSSESRFRKRLKLDTWGHYPVHTRAVLAWREANRL